MSFKRYNDDFESEVPEKKFRFDERRDYEYEISDLPAELLINVFSYLSRYNDLSNAALVCAQWRELTLAPELWRRIELPRMLRMSSKVTSNTVEKLLTRSNCIEYIDLCDYGQLIEDAVIHEVVRQERLRTLILTGCKQLSPGVLGSIAKCKLLHHLDLSELPLTNEILEMISESCTLLRHLEINRCWKITTHGLLSVIRNCTQLKLLRIAHCRKVTDDFLMTLAAVQSQIEVLDIAFCDFTNGGLKYLRKMPKLKDINASSVSSINDDVVSIFVNLSSIAIENLENLTSEGVDTIVRNNPNLETLSLFGCSSVDDIALDMISRSPCHSTLKSLDVSGCEVSEVGIDQILGTCTKLEELNFTRKPEDIQNKLRIKYPHVRINNPYFGF